MAASLIYRRDRRVVLPNQLETQVSVQRTDANLGHHARAPCHPNQEVESVTAFTVEMSLKGSK